MGKDARRYTRQTIKKLFALSGNLCAFPSCNKVLVNRNNAKDSQICHIEAASEGKKRYNPQMTDIDRADYSNLILLCMQHHDEIDTVNKYTVDVLKKMKSDHEAIQLNKAVQRNPSMLINAINAISSFDFEEKDNNETLNLFDPRDKISFNKLKRNVSVIQEYKIYHQKINELYNELEVEGSIKKEKLLRNIKYIYTEAKGKYTLNHDNVINIIKDNSDNIFDDIYNALLSKTQDSNLWEEDIVFGIRLIMVDAFLRCKILEEPDL